LVYGVVYVNYVTYYEYYGSNLLFLSSLGTRPSEIEKRVWEIGWGGSVHCAQNAGALPIDS